MRGLTKHGVGTPQAVLSLGHFRERLVLKIQSQFVCQWVAMIGINGGEESKQRKVYVCLRLKKQLWMI